MQGEMNEGFWLFNRKFFTHKDKLAPSLQLPGTMFTPLHFILAGIFLAAVILCAVLIHKKEKMTKPVFITLWVMLFTCLTMLLSKYHSYTRVNSAIDLFLPCVPTLILSIPANIVNLNTDYMFFRGTTAFLPAIFGGLDTVLITLILYVLYITVPACFYLPSFISKKVKQA